MQDLGHVLGVHTGGSDQNTPRLSDTEAYVGLV